MLDTINKVQQVPESIIEAVIPIFYSRKMIDEENNPLVDDLRFSLRRIDLSSASTIALMGRMIFTRHSLLEQLDQISCPTLIIVGNKNLPRPVSESKEMAALIKNSVLEIVDFAGHMSNFSKVT